MAQWQLAITLVPRVSLAKRPRGERAPIAIDREGWRRYWDGFMSGGTEEPTFSDETMTDWWHDESPVLESCRRFLDDELRRDARPGSNDFWKGDGAGHDHDATIDDIDGTSVRAGVTVRIDLRESPPRFLRRLLDFMADRQVWCYERVTGLIMAPQAEEFLRVIETSDGARWIDDPGGFADFLLRSGR